ncbi:unnamed protein product [Urochloa humidicola]
MDREKETAKNSQEESCGKKGEDRDESMLSANKDKIDVEMTEQESREQAQKPEERRKVEEPRAQSTGCGKCGRYGHRTEDCFKPIICKRCKKEGHVPRVCNEILPWECIAPICGIAAPGQGIHIIPDDDLDDSTKDMSNWALITIIEGVASAKQIEGEFKAMAGPSSTWRWYAKKVAENKFQMKFPSAKKVEDLAFFTRMNMRTDPNISFTVEKWNTNAGAKAELTTAWFRIFNIPVERRTEKVACYVGSLVGVPIEVDKASLKRYEYARVKLGCRDITKIPASVEGLLDRHLYDFTFQREVPTEGVTNSAGTTWTRNVDRPDEDCPSPKKPKWGGGGTSNQGATSSKDGSSSAGKGYGKQTSVADPTAPKDQQSAPSKGTTSTSEVVNAGEEDATEKDPQLGNENSAKGKDLSDEDSEDQGLRIGDILSPGGSKLSFGSFNENEATHLWKLQVNPNKSVVINEYGSNLFKNKNDPLAVTEAKLAMQAGIIPQELNNIGTEQVNQRSWQSSQKLVVLMESELETNTVPSPETGTQEPPTVDLSSQEDDQSQARTTAEEGLLSPVWSRLEMEVTEEEQADQGVNTSEDNLQHKEGTVAMVINEPNEGTPDQVQDRVKNAEPVQPEAAPPARQSERLKAQDLGGMKVADKAEFAAKRKNLEGLLKQEEKSSLELGALALKEAALHFHPQGATADDTGIVLLQ